MKAKLAHRLRLFSGLLASCGASVALLCLQSPETSRFVLEQPGTQHWLGTDHLGRDVFLLAVRAAGMTLLGVLASLSTAVAIGLIAGVRMSQANKNSRGNVLRLLAALLDMIGPLLPAVALLSLYPRISVTMMGVLLGIMTWPGVAGPFARFLSEMFEMPYVVASKALGATTWHQVRFHLLDPSLRLLVPLATTLGSSQLAILASLQFLGGFSAAELNIGSLVYEALSRLLQLHGYWLVAYWRSCSRFLSFPAPGSPAFSGSNWMVVPMTVTRGE